MVRAPPCHGGSCGFDSRRFRKRTKILFRKIQKLNLESILITLDTNQRLIIITEVLII